MTNDDGWGKPKPWPVNKEAELKIDPVQVEPQTWHMNDGSKIVWGQNGDADKIISGNAKCEIEITATTEKEHKPVSGIPWPVTQSGFKEHQEINGGINPVAVGVPSDKPWPIIEPDYAVVIPPFEIIKPHDDTAYNEQIADEAAQEQQAAIERLEAAIKIYDVERIQFDIPIYGEWPKPTDTFMVQDLAVHKSVIDETEWVVTHVPTLKKFDKATPNGRWQPEDLIQWCHTVQQDHREAWEKLSELNNENFDDEKYDNFKIEIQEHCLATPVIEYYA